MKIIEELRDYAKETMDELTTKFAGSQCTHEELFKQSLFVITRLHNGLKKLAGKNEKV